MKTMRLFLASALVTLILVCAAGVWAQSAPVKFYVTIEGAVQGRLSGGGGGAGGERIAGYQITSPREASSGMASGNRVISPRDVATGQATGKRQHKPITIIKEWDAASPKLMQAMQTNEALKSVTIEFVRRSADGKEEVYQTVRLTNARITAISPHAGDATAAQRSGRPKFEDITFTYEQVEARDKYGKTMASDSWTGQN